MRMNDWSRFLLRARQKNRYRHWSWKEFRKILNAILLNRSTVLHIHLLYLYTRALGISWERKNSGKNSAKKRKQTSEKKARYTCRLHIGKIKKVGNFARCQSAWGGFVGVHRHLELTAFWASRAEKETGDAKSSFLQERRDRICTTDIVDTRLKFKSSTLTPQFTATVRTTSLRFSQLLYCIYYHDEVPEVKAYDAFMVVYENAGAFHFMKKFHFILRKSDKFAVAET